MLLKQNCTFIFHLFIVSYKNVVDFHILSLYPVANTNSKNTLFWVSSLGFSTYMIMSVNRNRFFPFLKSPHRMIYLLILERKEEKRERQTDIDVREKLGCLPYLSQQGMESSTWVSKLLASLGHTGRRVVLGHILNTQTLPKTDEQKKVLSKFCGGPHS